MKYLTAFLAATFLAASITACAPVKKSPTRVKCPACGYEFDVPQQ